MIVIGIARKPEHTTLHMQDARTKNDTICVDVKEVRIDNGEPVTIDIGDQVWWQSGLVLWTPKAMRGRLHEGCGKTWDIQLPKVGYTHHSSHTSALTPEEIEEIRAVGGGA